MARRFIIRDIETKKEKSLNRRKLEFESLAAAKNVLGSLYFDLGNYYEIYDRYECIVAFRYKYAISNIKSRRKRR